LLAKKQKIHQKYIIAKKEMLEYQTAKQNVDKLFQTEKNQ